MGLIEVMFIGFDRNVIIFGVDMRLSVLVDTKEKDILNIGTAPTQGLGEHSLTAEKCIQSILLIIAKYIV